MFNFTSSHTGTGKPGTSSSGGGAPGASGSGGGLPFSSFSMPSAGSNAGGGGSNFSGFGGTSSTFGGTANNINNSNSGSSNKRQSTGFGFTSTGTTTSSSNNTSAAATTASNASNNITSSTSASASFRMNNQGPDASGGGGSSTAFSNLASGMNTGAAGFSNVGGSGVLTGGMGGAGGMQSFGMGAASAGGRSGGGNNNTDTTTDPFSGSGFGVGQAIPKKSGGNVGMDGGSTNKNSISTSRALITSTAMTSTNSANSSSSSSSNSTLSLESTCISADGRSFHSYLYDSSLEKHVIVSEIAPFGNNDSSINNNSGGSGGGGNAKGTLRITTILPPSTIGEALNIDQVLELICVDPFHKEENYNSSGSNAKRKTRQRLREKQRQFGVDNGDGVTAMNDCTDTLPWMCLYTRTSAFLLNIGYDYDPDDDPNNNSNNGETLEISGKLLHIIEPFEKQLLMAPRGSSIIRIRSAPTSANVFHRCGSMAMLLREGGGGVDYNYDGNPVDGYNTSNWSLVLYHGLPESLLAGTSSSSSHGSGNVGGTINPVSEGVVTTPLRFDYEDLVRGVEDTVDAENEAYRASSSVRGTGSSVLGEKNVADFCFLSPSSASSASGTFSATSILVLCNDGSIHFANPILFDGTVLPRTMVIDAISHLDEEIENSNEILQSNLSHNNSPAPTLEQEQMEARVRQCKAARRYLMDAFGISQESSLGNLQGSYYVGASVSRARSSSLGLGGRVSLSWQPRLQGPVVSASGTTSTPLPARACIESFGGVAGAGIVDGFVVARALDPRLNRASSSTATSASPVHVEFGVIPGEGAVLLPRFEFESDADCQVIDGLVRGTGMYVERALVMDHSRESDDDADDGRGDAVRSSAASGVSMRPCAIVTDPLDDIMVHILTHSRVVTLTTTAIAMMAQCFRAQMDGSSSRGNTNLSNIRTKVWSGLEANSKCAGLVGARVSGDVQLGHILLARLSNGSMEVVNITATQFLHEASEQMKSTSDQLLLTNGNDEALQALSKVQPLHETLQPLVDRVCDGLSKMGKIVGGATLPKDAGPESLAIFLETQRSCEVNIVIPMEEMSRVLNARRQLLVEMYEHQSTELDRLTKLLDEWKQKYESNLKRVVELEKNASILAERSSAVLTATRDLRPHITDAEATYFQDLKRYETTCIKWENTVRKLSKDGSTICDAMTAGGVENGEVRCLVDLPPEKIKLCHNLLQGESKKLRELEDKVKKSNATVQELSRAIAGIDSADTARLQLIGGDKENVGAKNTNLE